MTAPMINEAGPLHPDATHDVAMVLALIGALPDSADRIAMHLRERSCFGEPGDPCGCPIASYLAFGAYGTVNVNRDTIRVSVREWGFRFDTPLAVRDFIDNFDAGEYPFLYRHDGGA